METPMQKNNSMRFWEKMTEAGNPDNLTNREMKLYFDSVVSITKEIKNLTQRELNIIKSTVNSVLSSIDNRSKEALSEIDQKANDFYKNQLLKLNSEYSKKIKAIDEKMDAVKDGQDADEEAIKSSVIAEVTPKIQEDIYKKFENDLKPITANVILDKVREKPEGERWDIEDVNGLQKLLSELKRSKGGYGLSGLAVKNSVMVYDLSSSLNGVTTTFTLPAFWRITSVDLSSFPNGALRPTIDYTTSAGNSTITFTSEINPSTSLSSGQTCIITYVSA